MHCLEEKGRRQLQQLDCVARTMHRRTQLLKHKIVIRNRDFIDNI